MADAVRTTRLEKTTLSESITVTGTVESGSVANVTTSLSYPVKEKMCIRDRHNLPEERLGAIEKQIDLRVRELLSLPRVRKTPEAAKAR